ncbi:MAG: helix-turn-helix domain-containing protein [Flavobacteriaceae bacterium]
MKTLKRRYKISSLLFFLLFFIPIFVFSQDNLTLRKKEFYKSLDSEKLYVKNLNIGARRYTFKQENLQKYYSQLLKEYQEKKSASNNLQKAIWLYEIGYIQISLNRAALATKTFEKALKRIDKHKNKRAYKYLNIELADAYRHTGQKKKSNDIFTELLKLPLIKKDTVIKIWCLRIMSENYEILKEYQKAMKLSLQLYKHSLKIKDYDDASYKLIQMGRIASYIEHDTAYFEYFHLANKMAQKSGVKSRIGNNLVNTGIAYRKAGYPLKSLKYLLDAESYATSYTSYGYIYNLLGLSATYSSLDNIPQAFSYAKKAFKIAKEIDAFNYLFDSNLKLANCFIKMNQNDSARIYLKKALRLDRINENTNQSINLYKQLSDISIKLKDYASAVAYLDSSYLKYTKFITNTNDDKLAQLKVESDYYIHMERITALISRNRVEKEKSKYFLIIIINTSIALLITILLVLIIRQRLHQLKESHFNLVKKNIELDRLNHKLYECEITPKRKIKLEHVKDEGLIIAKLKRFLHKDEIFKNSDLSLISLAELLKTNTSYLSAIINNHFHCNLRSLLNKYRIDKARKMLISNKFKHYSMEGISVEVGFKSRSVFYQTFKNITGLTPTLYVKNYTSASQDLENLKDSKIEHAF